MKILKISETSKHSHNIKNKVKQKTENAEIKTAEDWNILGCNSTSFKKAVQCFEKALELDPNYTTALVNLIYRYYYKKNYDKTIECCKRVINIEKHHPERWWSGDYAEAWRYLGNVYRDKKQYNRALKYYKKALEIGEDDETWCDMGYLYYLKGDYEKAIECYKNALKCCDNDPCTWDMLGEIYFEKINDYEKAREYYEQRIESWPDCSRPWSRLAVIYIKKMYDAFGNDEIDKAMEYYKKSVESIKNAFTNALSNIGWNYFDYHRRKKDYQKAIEYFNNALKIDPNHTDALYGLGTCYKKMKNYAEALKCYEKAIEIFKTRPDEDIEMWKDIMGIAYLKRKIKKLNPNSARFK